VSELFYLQCRGVVGNSVLWWALNDQGYTCDIRCARVWTQEEIDAKQLRSFERVWPKELVDRVVQHHIDIQDLTYVDNIGRTADYPHTLKHWRPDLCEQPRPVARDNGDE
jgi:hypothetical protein